MTATATVGEQYAALREQVSEIVRSLRSHGDVNARVVCCATPMWIYRAAMGRRTRAEICERFELSSGIDAYVELLFVFAPPEFNG